MATVEQLLIEIGVNTSDAVAGLGLVADEIVRLETTVARMSASMSSAASAFTAAIHTMDTNTSAGLAAIVSSVMAVERALLNLGNVQQQAQAQAQAQAAVFTALDKATIQTAFSEQRYADALALTQAVMSRANLTAIEDERLKQLQARANLALAAESTRAAAQAIQAGQAKLAMDRQLENSAIARTTKEKDYATALRMVDAAIANAAGDQIRINNLMAQRTTLINQQTASMQTLTVVTKSWGEVMQHAVGVMIGNLASRGIMELTHAMERSVTVAFESVQSIEKLANVLQITVAKELTAKDSTLAMSDALVQASARSQELVQWMVNLAAATPVDEASVAEAFKLATAYGFTTKEAQHLTEVMIDFESAGHAGSMDNVAHALGVMGSKAKVSAKELNQLAQQGINARQILADAFGVTTAKLEEMRAAGINSALAVKAIVASLEHDYSGAAIRASQTLYGTVDRLKDDVIIGLRTLFTEVFNAIKPMMESVISTITSPAFKQGLKDFGAGLAAVATAAYSVVQVLAVPLSGAISIVSGTMSFLTSSLPMTIASLTALAVVIGGPLVTAITSFGMAIIVAIGPLGWMAAALAATVGAFNSFNAKWDDTEQRFLQGKAFFVGATESIKNFSAAIKEAGDVSLSTSLAHAAQVIQLASLQAAYQKLIDERAKMAMTGGTETQAYADNAVALNNLQDRITELSGTMNDHTATIVANTAAKSVGVSINSQLMGSAAAYNGLIQYQKTYTDDATAAMWEQLTASLETAAAQEKLNQVKIGLANIAPYVRDGFISEKEAADALTVAYGIASGAAMDLIKAQLMLAGAQSTGAKSVRIYKGNLQNYVDVPLDVAPDKKPGGYTTPTIPKAKGGGSSKTPKTADQTAMDATKAAADTAKALSESIIKFNEASKIINEAKPVDMEKLKSFAASMAEGLKIVSRSLIEVNNELLSKHYADLAANAKATVDVIGSGVDAFMKLNDWKAPTAEALQSFGDVLSFAIRMFGQAAEDNKNFLTQTAKDFVALSTDVVGLFGTGVEGLMKLKDWESPSRDALWSFVQTLAITIGYVHTASQENKNYLTQEAKDFVDLSTKIVALFGSGAENFAKLKDYHGVSKDALFSLLESISFAVEQVVAKAKTMEPKLMESAKIFGDVASAVIKPIGDGLKAFEGLQNFVGIPREKLNLLIAAISLATDLMVTAAARMNGDQLKAAVAFATAADAILQPIKTALDAFKGLQDYAGTPQAVFYALDADIQASIKLMQYLASIYATDGLKAAQEFAKTSKDIFDGFASALPALDSIKKFEDIPADRFSAIEFSFVKALELMKSLAWHASQFNVEAGNWRDSLMTAAAAIRAGVDAVTALNGVNVDVTAHASISASGSSGGSAATPVPSAQPPASTTINSSKAESVTVNVSASQVASEVDINTLAYTIAGVISKRQR